MSCLDFPGNQWVYYFFVVCKLSWICWQWASLKDFLCCERFASRLNCLLLLFLVPETECLKGEHHTRREPRVCITCSFMGRSRGGDRGFGPPEKVQKYSNDLDPLKTTKLPSQHSMVGLYWHVSKMPAKCHFNDISLAVRWWPTFSCILILSPFHQLKKVLDPLWQNFLDPRMSLIFSVKPDLSGHSKIDKTKVLKTNGSLMQVKSIAECSTGAFCNTFGLH